MRVLESSINPTTMELRHDVEQVARLARLQLTDQELTTLAGQFGDILRYVQQLQQIPTRDVPPTSHVLNLSNVMRSDERQPSLSPDAALAGAPAKHGYLFKVPKIIE